MFAHAMVWTSYGVNCYASRPNDLCCSSHGPLYEQVWYPDSAQKTADALQEYDREGLPLVILANWRGFSGGKRDLFEGILQAGASIVESLRCYRWPVMVYMPPGCDLRGGAWVVIDSQINSSMVEMYAGVPSCLYTKWCICT